MLATLRHYPRTVKLLLSATLMLTLAKAITFPYLVIYLTRHFALDITQVGLVIGSSLIVGSLLSVYGGFLVDRISSYRLLLGLSALFVVGFIGTVLAQTIWAFYGETTLKKKADLDNPILFHPHPKITTITTKK